MPYRSCYKSTNLTDDETIESDISLSFSSFLQLHVQSPFTWSCEHAQCTVHGKQLTAWWIGCLNQSFKWNEYIKWNACVVGCWCCLSSLSPFELKSIHSLRLTCCHQYLDVDLITIQFIESKWCLVNFFIWISKSVVTCRNE